MDYIFLMVIPYHNNYFRILCLSYFWNAKEKLLSS